MDKPKQVLPVNSVFQINNSYSDDGWKGVLVIAYEIKNWGIGASVFYPRTRGEIAEAPIRLDWSVIEYVGQAPIIPNSELD